MTKSELATLKEELKAEILREIRRASGPRVAKPWDGVRGLVIGRLQRFNTYRQYQILSAVSTIIRCNLGIRSVMVMSEEQAPRAREIANQVIDILLSKAATLDPTGTEEG